MKTYEEWEAEQGISPVSPEADFAEKAWHAALATTEQPARQDAAYAEVQRWGRSEFDEEYKVRPEGEFVFYDDYEKLLADNDRLTERLAHHDEAANKCIDTAIKQGLAERDALAERVAVLERDAARYQYLKSTTTAVRNSETGEREECTPDQFEAAIDSLIGETTPHPHADEAAKVGSVAPVAVAIVYGAQVQWLDGAAKVPARSTLFWFPPSPAEGKSR